MHLTKSEQQIMEIFWQADHPMAQTEVIHTCEDRKWKERSIFSMLNSLMAKGAPPCVKTDPRPAKPPRQRLLRPRASSKLQQAAESGKVHNSI